LQTFTKYSSDSDAELEAIRVAALEAGADAAVSAWHWGEGGKGAIELAKAVVNTCSLGKQSFRYLYDLDTSIEEKIGIISREIYGAEGIDLSGEAKKKVALYEKQVFHLRGLFLMCRVSENSQSVSQRHSIRFQLIRMPKGPPLVSEFLFEI
jgi:formyltetrahydrofolate synthetase